ncbi:unnamed protein product [Ostreobium quekettii]|uniref:GYF domain-containing protein n=1 Tax=Ostreobium quekettii TaxID=121088 RepID=A0A8S1J1Z9_9CHLO|nr:unnamed protein product [Ostreobium quekettii]
MDIYQGMLRQSKVHPPNNADLPALLQRSGSKVGWHDLQVDQWVYFDPMVGCKGPVQKAELLGLWEGGRLMDETTVAPMGWFLANATPMKQMQKIWKEDERRVLGRPGSGDPGMVRVGSQAELAPELPRRASGQLRGASIQVARRIGDDEILSDQWVYKDMQGCEQGPFTWAQLQDWWMQNFLDQELPVRAESWEVGQFVPMRRLLAAVFSGMEEWVYKDEQGAVQGPFAKEQILAWWEDGYMPANLPTRPATWEKDEFLALVHFLVRWKGISDGWLYRDAHDVTHGPFPKTSILEKVGRGELSGLLPVKPDLWEGDVFVPLEHLLQAL